MVTFIKRLIVFGLLCTLSAFSHAASIKWDGGGDDASCGGGAGDGNKWSCSLNWDGDIPPGAADIAVFDATSAKNATIDVDPNVEGVSILAGYTGIVTQATAIPITIGITGYSQQGGTFSGGNSAITVGGIFTAGGTAYTGTSATTSVVGNFTLNATSSTFTGTLELVSASSKTVSSTVPLGHLTISTGSDGVTVTPVSTLTVAGNLTINQVGSIDIGTINVGGNVTLVDTTLTGAGTIAFTGTGAQSLSATTVGQLPNVIINKTGGSLSIDKTIEVNSNWTHIAGTVSPTTTSTIVFLSNTKTVTSGGQPFHHVELRMLSSNLTLADNLDVNGNFKITTANVINGNTITVAGNVDTLDSSVSGSTGITLDGGAAQSISTNAGLGRFPDGVFAIDKTSDIATLGDPLILDGVGQDLTISNGSFNINGRNLTVADTITLSAGTTFAALGDEIINYTTVNAVTGSNVNYTGTGSYTGISLGNNLSNLLLSNGTWTLNAGLTLDADLTLTTGSTLNTSTFILSVGGNLSNTGTLNSGTNDLSVTGNFVNDGIYNDTGGILSITGNLQNNATRTIGLGSVTLNLGGSLTNSGSFTKSSSTGAMTVSGDFTNTGTFGTSGAAQSVAGNWNNSGSYTAAGNTVTLNGTTPQIITGTTTFANLTKTTTTDTSLTFPSGLTQTITGTLTLTGTSTAFIYLVSDSAGIQWNINPSGSRNINFVVVQDSNNSSGTSIDLNTPDPVIALNGGNNFDWIFTADEGFIWTNGNGTGLWNDVLNWSGGIVPGPANIALFTAGFTANASVNVSASVSGIRVVPGYTGTISQANGTTLTVGANAFVMESGTFVGGDNTSTITLNGGLFVNSGTFTSTAGTLELFDDFFLDPTLATFNHNLGTVRFADTGTSADNITALASQAFNNVTFDTGSTSGRTWIVTTGSTLQVDGNLIFNNSSTGTTRIDGPGVIHAKGNVTLDELDYGTGSVLVVMNGAGAQNLTGHNVLPGSRMPNFEFNPSGNIIMLEKFYTTNDWTFNSLGGGTLDPGTSTVTFADPGSTANTISGSHALYNVNFDTGRVENRTWNIASGTTLTVKNILNLDNTNASAGNTNLQGGGILKALSEVNVDDRSYDGAAILQLAGAAQAFNGGGGTVPNFHVLATANVAFTGSIKAGGNWTIDAPTAFTAALGTTVTFADPGSVTGFITGSHSLENVVFNTGSSTDRTWNVALGTTVTINNVLTIDNTNTGAIRLQGEGTLSALGDVNVGAENYQGAATLSLDTTTTQTMTGANGELPNVVLNGPGNIILSGTIAAGANWTYDTVTPPASLTTTGSTVRFANPGSTTYTISGSHKLYDVVFNTQSGSDRNWAIDSATILTVDNNLSLANTGAGNVFLQGGGTIAVWGNLNVNNKLYDGSAIIKLVGSTTQTITGVGGALPNFEIAKTGGSSTVISGSIQARGNWTFNTSTGGNSTISGGTVIFSDYTSASSGGGVINGTHTLENVTFNTSRGIPIAWSITDGVTLTVSNTLSLSNSGDAPSPINSTTTAKNGIIDVHGDININQRSYDGTVLIRAIGSGPQTITGSGGMLPNFEIAKPGGVSLSISGSVGARGDWTFTSGNPDITGGTVIFSDYTSAGSGGTISGTHSLNNVIFNTTRGITLTWNIQSPANLTVNGKLSLTNDGSGDTYLKGGGTILVYGDIDIDTKRYDSENLAGGAVSLRAVGSAPQTLTGLGADTTTVGRLPNFEIAKTPGSTLTLTGIVGTGGDWILSSGNIVASAGSTLYFRHGNNSTHAISGTQELENITFNAFGGGGTHTWNLSAGTVLTANGNLTLEDTSGSSTTTINNETINVLGNLRVSKPFNGTTLINVSGPGLAQQINAASAESDFDMNLTIDKTAGEAQLMSTLIMNAADQKLIVQNGTLNVFGAQLDVNGTGAPEFRVSGTGQLRMIGSEIIAQPPTLDPGSIVTYYGLAGPYTIITGTWNFQNLVFDSVSGVFNLNSSTSSVNQSLTITAGTFDLNGNSLAGTGTFSNNGILQLQGSETFTLPMDTDSGWVRYDGAGIYPNLMLGNTYFNLGFVGSGTFDHTGPLILGGDLLINSGTLISAAGQDITLAGNWSGAGTYTHGNNTVTFNGTNQQIGGSHTFFSLYKTVSTADTLTFEAGQTTSVQGALTLSGAPGQLLALRSTVPNTYWLLNVSGTMGVSYVDAQDSDASPGLTINSFGSTLLNTVNWYGTDLGLPIIKQVWDAAGPTCRASSIPKASCNASSIRENVIKGTVVTFLIYVKNPLAATTDSVQILDMIDDVGFTYVAGTLYATPNDGSLAQPNASDSDLAIFNAATLLQTEAADTGLTDFASINTGLSPDRLTIGAPDNTIINIPAGKTFAIKFQATKN